MSVTSPASPVQERETFVLLPAVDISAGLASQVIDGDRDPMRVAQGWVDRGAGWIHLVDLDLAFGRGQNHALVSELIAALPVPVQLSGGITDLARLEDALRAGARRVVTSSAALAEPEWLARAIAEHGDRIAVGVDVADEQVVARGSRRRFGPVSTALPGIAALGASCHVVADASRDGTRAGSDLTLFAGLGRALGRVIASGGVAGLEDLRALAAAPGVTGAVVGAGLYAGGFSLEEAQAMVQR